MAELRTTNKQLRLTRAELDAVVGELERRNRANAFGRFRPQSYQARIADKVFDHRITIFCGGNGVGKTTFLVAVLLSMIQGFQPWDKKRHRMPPVRVCLSGPDFTNYHPKKSIPTILSFRPLDTWVSTKKNSQGVFCEFTDPNGSVLELMSYEQHLRRAADQASPYEGIDWHAHGFDEPFPHDLFVSVHRGVMKNNGKILIAQTPIADHWMYEELYLPGVSGTDPDIYAEKVPIFAAVKSDENPTGHLDQGALQGFLNTAAGRDDERARIYGDFVHLVGLIFKDWKRDVHTYDPKKFEIQPDWPKAILIDPHDRRPFAISFWAMDPQGRKVCFREWPTDPFNQYRYYDNRWEDYVAFLKRAMEETPGGPASFQWLVADPNFSQTKKGETNLSLHDYFWSQGLFFVDPSDVNNNISTGHAAIRRDLSYDPEKAISTGNSPRIVVNKECWNMIWSFERYTWKSARNEFSDDSEAPSEDGKDFIDGLRYFESLEPRFFSVAGNRPRYNLRGLMNNGMGAR